MSYQTAQVNPQRPALKVESCQCAWGMSMQVNSEVGQGQINSMHYSSQPPNSFSQVAMNS